MKHLLTFISLLFIAALQPVMAAPNTVLLDNYYNHEKDKNGHVYHYTWDDTSWGGFYILGNMIRNAGYGLSTLTTAPTMESLAQCQAYIIVDPDNENDSPNPNYMDAATAKVIAQWVKQGGRLVVFANDNKNCDIKHIDLLTSIFGLTFNDNTILELQIPDDKNPVLTDTLKGNIPGADKFYMRGTCSISCKGKAKPLVWTKNKETVIAQANYGKGSVIAVADPFIYNEYIGHVLVSNNVDNAAGARYLVNFMTGAEATTTRQLAGETTWTKQDVVSLITTVNGYWQGHNKAEERSFWDNAAYHTGNIEAYKITGNMNQLSYSTRWAEHNRWQGATEPDPAKWQYKQYGEDQQHVLFGDWQICFQTFIDLYNINRGGLSAIAPASPSNGSVEQHVAQNKADGQYSDNMVARAKEVMGYEAHSAAHDYWWWADALYMVMPVMTKMYKLTGDEVYLDKLYENLCYSDSIMLDNETGLYFRDGKYIYPKHKSANGKKDFWARGDGWVLAGLAKVLQDMPTNYKHYTFFKDKYVRLAKAVAALQQPEGYWTRSMADPDHAPGPETSGTAFFTYGILWGVNNGFLDKAEFLPVINNAWDYLTTTVLQLDGEVGYVQPIGERAIPGQTVGAHSQANFGVGAYLLAASEYYRFLK